MRRFKKGQAVFEFVVASLILFAVIFYTINFVSVDFGMRHERFLTDHLEGNALRVSDLVMSPSVGIVSSWPDLSTVKMGALDASCAADYIETLDDLGLREELPYARYTHMKLTVIDLDSVVYVDCGRSAPEGTETAEVTRFGYLPAPINEIAIVSISLWGA
ncbi:MAG: hypothetical protein JSV63_00680 [Candidatus Aenigmatarchaeota archaeon]|nr:MAG: hypothetical protein JSV63_00680 [Candidatus Aenigmarchaeota archaeon]